MKIDWDNQKCIHSGEYVRGLPTVFRIENEKFVIEPSGALAIRED